MKFSSFVSLSLFCSQVVVVAAFASEPVTQIILSEVVKSKPPQEDNSTSLDTEDPIQKMIDDLTLKITNMKDESGRPVDPTKISSRVCYIDVQHSINDQLVPGLDKEVFVFYHSRYGKDFSPNVCSSVNFGGGLQMIGPGDAPGGL